jgi:CRISPR/Cas system-associated protein Csm6
MQNAVSIAKKLKNFIHDSNNYVAGRLRADQVDESLLFKVNIVKFSEQVNGLSLVEFNFFIGVIFLTMFLRHYAIRKTRFPQHSRTTLTLQRRCMPL